MVFIKKDKDHMLYSVVKKQITQFQSIYSPNHIAANPKGYVQIPDVVEDIEKANLQKSDHRYIKCANSQKRRFWGGASIYIYMYTRTLVIHANDIYI